MRIWDILDIEVTKDVSVIKRAYAKKLKIYHPEDDAEGYQRLREAYESAIIRAKYPDDDEDDYFEQDDDDVEIEIDSNMDASEAQIARFLDPVDQWMEQVDDVYSRFSLRIDINRWTELLDADVIWNVQMKKRAGYRLFLYLHDNHDLPYEVWLLLENGFHWREQLLNIGGEYSGAYTESFVAHYLEQLKVPGLRYSFLPVTDDFPHEAYLDHRNRAFQMLRESSETQAEISIEAAWAIFKEDPEVIRLKIELALRAGNHIAALALSEEGIRLFSEQLDFFVYRNRSLHALGETEKCAEECRRVLGLSAEHLDTLHLLAACYRELKDSERASTVYKQILKTHPNDLKALFYFASRNKKAYLEKINGKAYSKLFIRSVPKRKLFYLGVFAFVNVNVNPLSIIWWYIFIRALYLTHRKIRI
jgi:hypothetical protein